MAKKKKAQTPVSKQTGGVDLAEVERLLAFMDTHDLEEFDYERNGQRIRLKKPSGYAQGGFRALSAPEIHVAGDSAARQQGEPATSAAPATREPASDAGRSDDLHVVKSPIV